MWELAYLGMKRTKSASNFSNFELPEEFNRDYLMEVTSSVFVAFSHPSF